MSQGTAVRDISGIRLDLDSHIRMSRWKDFRATFRALEPAVKKQVVELKGGKKWHGKNWLLLHRLLMYRPYPGDPPLPMDVLEDVIDAAPELLFVHPLPLWLATHRKPTPSLPVIECLLMKDTTPHRQSLYETNEDGETALLRVVRSYRVPNRELVELLIQYDHTKQSLWIPSAPRTPLTSSQLNNHGTRIPLYYNSCKQYRPGQKIVLEDPDIVIPDYPFGYFLRETYRYRPVSQFITTRIIDKDDAEAKDQTPHKLLLLGDGDGTDGNDDSVHQSDDDDEEDDDENFQWLKMTLALGNTAFPGIANDLWHLLFLRLENTHNLRLKSTKKTNGHNTPLLLKVLYMVCHEHWEFFSVRFGLKILDRVLSSQQPSAAMACTTPNKNGKLPLQLALESQKCAPFLRQLLLACPQSVRLACRTNAHSGNQRLPLHLAILNYPSGYDTIHVIFEAFPEATKVQDAITGFYPFQLAALPPNVGKNYVRRAGALHWEHKKVFFSATLDDAYQVSDIYCLLRACPEVLGKYS